jgi:predicted lipoprotein
VAFYGGAFCRNRDLVGMQVMQAQFVEQRLFNNLMRQQEWVDPDCFQSHPKVRGRWRSMNTVGPSAL